MAGVDDFEVRYVEVVGNVVSAPQVIRTVQRRVGIALVFDGTGQPIVSYLGGAPGFAPGTSLFWFQSDAVIARRTPPATWTETVLVADGDVASCGNPASDRGFLVGLFPAMAFDGVGRLHLASRDVHDGQFPLQDLAASDVEVVEDVIGNRVFRCAQPGGIDKQGHGGHLRMAIGPGNEPMIVHDQILSMVTGPGRDVRFQRRTSTGSWTQPAVVATVSDTMTGASLAYHPTTGAMFAVTDGATSRLQYWSNSDSSLANAAWQRVDVLTAGSSGWYPSLAVSSAGVPSIAFYHCSPRASVAADTCLQSEDELRLATQNGGAWTIESVDPEGGLAPQLAISSSGKRVIAYRTPAARRSNQTVEPTAGALKLALER